jgi:hypothetical protein
MEKRKKNAERKKKNDMLVDYIRLHNLSLLFLIYLGSFELS